MDDRLFQLIKIHSWTPHRKVLTCAPDVEEAIRGDTILAEVAGPVGSWEHQDSTLAWMTGIDVVIAGDSAPGTWQLIRHDHCKVKIHYQGSPGYDGGCGAESGPSGRFNAVCTLDPDHDLAHEAWGTGGDHPAASWPGSKGGLPPATVSHGECTIIATEPSDPRATVART